MREIKLAPALSKTNTSKLTLKLQGYKYDRILSEKMRQIILLEEAFSAAD